LQIFLNSLNWHNVSGIEFDSAFVDASFDIDVPASSPIGSPRIADDPVVDSVESAPSDQDDSVILFDSVIASRVRVHSTPD